MRSNAPSVGRSMTAALAGRSRPRAGWGTTGWLEVSGAFAEDADQQHHPDGRGCGRQRRRHRRAASRHQRRIRSSSNCTPGAGEQRVEERREREDRGRAPARRPSRGRSRTAAGRDSRRRSGPCPSARIEHTSDRRARRPNRRRGACRVLANRPTIASRRISPPGKKTSSFLECTFARIPAVDAAPDAVLRRAPTAAPAEPEE